MSVITDRLSKLKEQQVRLESAYKTASAAADKARADVDVLVAQLNGYADVLDPQRMAIIRERHDKIVFAQANYAKLSESSDERLRTFQDLQSKADRRQRLLTFYAGVLDDVTETYIDRLESALNEVYQYAFQKPEKRVKLETKDKYNRKVLEPTLYHVFDGKEYPEDLDESGYSLSVVLGSVLLVYFLLYTEGDRIIWFDESISGLHVDVATRFFDLLHVFTEKLGFRFAIISHETRYAELVDHIYSVKSGSFLKER